MATQPAPIDQSEADVPDTSDDKAMPTLLDAIAATNLVPLLPASEIGKIGSDVVREYAIDLASCADFHQRFDRAMDAPCRCGRTSPFRGPMPRTSCSRC
jgi:hypothetical protein